MSEIKVSQVRSRADRKAFIRFPWRIYDNDPVWVPPLIIERKAFLNCKRHPFYRHGDAALFLARQNQKIVGRIMASDDPNYNAVHHSNVGCFGLFECIDDRKVAAALFEAAEGWLRRKGRHEIMGPIDYSTNYVCGLLIAGFQFPPTILTAHNPPYYAELIEGCGFEKRMDFYAWWFSDATRAAARLRKLATRLQTRRRFTIRPGNLRDLPLESTRLRRIYNEAWRDNWGYVPFTEAEFAHLTNEMKPLLRPEFTAIAEVDGEGAGFIIALPDINVALQKINGRLTTFGIPIGLIRLLYEKRRLRRARVIAMGVRPEFRQHGVAEMLVLRIIEEVMFELEFNGELSMTLENNVMINRFLEAIGAQRYKTYRIYSKSIA
ncbi:MAG: N-acetyltransferase [Verrucomicrobia bacterium]|nr:MAG: N-acetyltransferase [Verrucomicrobiota bacterium]